MRPDALARVSPVFSPPTRRRKETQMNLLLDLTSARNDAGENARLWLDGRIWWVNCVAVEAGWAHQAIGGAHLADARRRRDAMLAAFIGTW